MQENAIIHNIRTESELCTADFDYLLPEELIAQHPSEKRDECRLLCLDRESGAVTHQHFKSYEQ